MTPARRHLPEEVVTALRDMARIGNNINQIARGINWLILSGQVLNGGEEIQIALLDVVHQFEHIKSRIL
jgi:hypothetical protein